MSQSKTGLIIGGSIFGIFLAIGLFLFLSYIGAHNYGVGAEEDLKASYTDSQNVLSQYSLKIAESAQIPEMYKNDLKEVYTAAITGRYGADGSKAMMQWIQEKNPNFDSSLYKSIQQSIEAGRNKFEVSQRLVIEHKKNYEKNLRFFWKGTLLRMAGFPTFDLDTIKIIKSEHSDATFKTGIDQGLKLR